MKGRGVKHALENAISVIVQMVLIPIATPIMQNEGKRSQNYLGFCFGMEAGMTIGKSVRSN